MAWGDPDAVYDLPEEKRESVIAMVMANRNLGSNGWNTGKPPTLPQIQSFLLAIGYLQRKNTEDSNSVDPMMEGFY